MSDDIWVQDSGGDGPPVVLVHGDWTDSGVWSALTPRLRDRYRVISYDLRGFGRSARPQAPFTRLGDLLALLDDCDVPAAIVVGHSGGGGTALDVALAAPERVRALVLIAPGVHDYPWPHDDPYFEQAGSLIQAGDRDGLLELGLTTWAPGATSEDSGTSEDTGTSEDSGTSEDTGTSEDSGTSEDTGTEDHIRAMFRGAISSWFAIGDLEQPDPPAFERLGELTIPAVMVLGDREYPMVADVSRQIAARIDGCRTILVEGADHLLPLRAPRDLADLIGSC